MPTHNTHDVASHFPRRSNLRVPNMKFHSEVDTNGKFRAELGVYVAALATGIISAASTAAILTRSGVGIIANHRNNMGRYGRNVTIVLSAAGTPTVTVYGLDYLGQPMAEAFTAAGTTPVVGKKAFKEVQSISTSATVAGTINVGYGNVLGLPFAATAILEEYVDQVVPPVGTKVVAFLPVQTATSNDPRGTWTPEATVIPNGSREYILHCHAVEGDYHGQPHFAG